MKIELKKVTVRELVSELRRRRCHPLRWKAGHPAAVPARVCLNIPSQRRIQPATDPGSGARGFGHPVWHRLIRCRQLRELPHVGTQASPNRSRSARVYQTWSLDMKRPLKSTTSGGGISLISLTVIMSPMSVGG